MSGQIFISYRREDSAASAGRVYDRLIGRFPSNRIFIDVDNIAPGVDFVKAIEKNVGSCDVLISVVGKHWLTATDEDGKRRLENTDDFVRLEIATALKRGIRVIPVLVDGASMPRSGDLPDELKSLVRLQALKVSQDRFRSDSEALITAVNQALKEASAERRKRGLTSPGKKMWLSVAGVVTVLALVVIAAILFFGSHRPEAKPSVSTSTPVAIIIPSQSPKPTSPEESPNVQRWHGALNNQGDVLRAQGHLTDALNSYRDGLAIAEKLASQNPSNADLQIDLSVSYNKVGDALRDLGNLADALQSYRDGLAVAKKLVQLDPSNAGWQSELSVSYNKVGDVLRDQGNLADALQSYRIGLAIAKKLAQLDPSNPGWQSDLSVSYNKVGEVLRDQGDLSDALQSHRIGLAIAEKLTQQNPSNTDWQSDLAVSYERIGDALRDQGDLAGALQNYRDGLAIAEKLAQQNPSNADLQSDLSISYNKVGDVLRDLGDLANALKSHRLGLAIAEKLAQQVSSNTDWQSDLAVSYERIGDVLRDQDDLAGALQNYRDGLAIAEKLAQQDPSNAGWQSELAYSYWQVATLWAKVEPRSKSEAHEMLEKARTILVTLKGRSWLTNLQQTWLNSINQQLNEK